MKFNYLIFIFGALVSSMSLADSKIPLFLKGKDWYVACSFNGSPTTCLLDTGNYESIIPGTLQSTSSKFPIASSPFTDPNGTWREVNITLGSELTYPTKALRYNDDVALNPDGTPLMTTGVFGLPALDFRAWELDFDANQMMAETEIPTPLKTLELKRADQGHFAIPVNILGTTAYAMFDTGTEAGLFVDTSVFNKIKSQLQDCHDGTQFNGVTTIPVKVCAKAELSAGGLQIDVVYLVALDFSQDRNLSYYLKQGWTAMMGYGVMRGHIWHFDLKNNLWAIEH